MAPAVTKVLSADGTEIAYWTFGGHGEPLLLVHGSMSDHTRFAPVVPHLLPHVRVHAIDRRGRGASADGDEYEAAREFEDVAAVVDSIAAAAGSPVHVYGHSYGGFAAFGAALLTSNIGKLVLYEGWAPVKPDQHALPSDLEQRINALLDAGESEEALITFLRDFVRMPAEVIEARRSQPSWSASVGAAPTVTREMRAASSPATAFDPERAANITVPVLLLTGSDSPESMRDDPEVVSAALPNAQLVVLDGQAHGGDLLAPRDFAACVVEFLRGDQQGPPGVAPQIR